MGYHSALSGLICRDQNQPPRYKKDMANRIKFSVFRFSFLCYTVHILGNFDSELRSCLLLHIGQTSVTVCAGTDRVREVYLSRSHKVEVRLVVKRQQELGYFLLKYEGN